MAKIHFQGYQLSANVSRYGPLKYIPSILPRSRRYYQRWPSSRASNRTVLLELEIFDRSIPSARLGSSNSGSHIISKGARNTSGVACKFKFRENLKYTLKTFQNTEN